MSGRRAIRQGDGVRQSAIRRKGTPKKKTRKRVIKKRTFVEPFRELSDFDKVVKALREDGKIREALLINVMYLAHLRVSDALLLRFRDFINADGTLNNELLIIEKKTGKELRFLMFEDLGRLICDYWVKYGSPSGEYFIFRSNAINKRTKNLPWHRSYVWRFLKDYAAKVGITYNIGTHTLRKTWAFHAYMSGEMTIVEIMEELGHSKLRDTFIYCGINDEVRRDHYKAMSSKVSDSLVSLRYDNLPSGAEIYRRYRRKRKKRRIDRG